MIPLPTVLIALGRAGIELALHPVEPEAVRYRPVAALTLDLGCGLREHKAAILALIGGPPCLPGDRISGGTEPTDAEYVGLERFGVADDLELPTHAGSPAWLIAVGESMGALIVKEPVALSQRTS